MKNHGVISFLNYCQHFHFTLYIFHSPRHRSILFIAISIALSLSLISTWLINQFLIDRIAVIGDLAGFQRAFNPGIAFSVTFPPVIQHLLIGIALIAITYMAIKQSRTVLSSIGFGLIIGGALGNIIDRLPDGLVTDFIQVGMFPIFNIADSCITVGVILLLANMLWMEKGRVRSKE
jgi:signal peptidase II